MARHLAKVQETLTSPDAIYESKRNPASNLYFKAYTGLPAGNRYVMVVAHIKRGYVQSSFPVQNISKGGRLLWRKA
ncbi:MAG: hypothetical protein FJ279_01960 [Planctomycetes bacterium]|nr:hypothetical protein [Planctomycetota bacterium]